MAKIPGMGVAAKQVQKQIQKSFNRGGREVLENVGRQTPDLLNTVSDMNKSGIVKSIDSGLYSPEDVEKVFRNKDYSGLTDIANDGNSKALVDQTNQQYAEWVHPKVSDPEVSNQLTLDSFIAQNQVDLESAPRGQMMTVQGMQEVPMYPGTKEDLLPKIKEYIKLQQATGSKAPKGGWEKIFGHVADEEGNPLRITGGVKEGKPARWQKHNMPSRKFAESLFSEGEDSARLKIMSAQKNQKHHAEWAIKESEIFGTTDDGVARPAEDLDYIDSEIKRRFGIDFGNKDAQEIAQSQRAHMGVKGDEASLQLASHRILDNISDVQGFRDWQFEASDIKFEMPIKRANQKNPTVKWFKNKDGIIYEPARGQKEGKAIGDMKAFKEKYGKEANPVAFRMPGTTGGTYSPVQRHGFSQELIETIRKLDDPEDVIKAIGLFKDAGIGELRKGASALATTLLEKHDIDPKTGSWVKNNMEQALEVAGIMKQQPGVKEIPEFQNFMNYMEEIQRAVKGKNY